MHGPQRGFRASHLVFRIRQYRHARARILGCTPLWWAVGGGKSVEAGSIVMQENTVNEHTPTRNDNV